MLSFHDFWHKYRVLALLLITVFLVLIYRAGIACVFFLTSRFGGVHQTIVCQKH